MSEASAGEWRPIVAALANDDARTVFARLVLDVAGDPFAGFSPSRRAHVRQQLASAGIIQDVDDVATLDASVFSRLLRQAPVKRPAGVERFLRDGRITQYPARPTERLELLAWIAARILEPGEVVTEREISARLSSFTDDVVALRRYLVDAELVERTPTGSEYSLVSR